MPGRFDPSTYVTVAQRVTKFYKKYPTGRIINRVVEHDKDAGFIMMESKVFRLASDTEPAAVGHAFENRTGPVNTTSYVENCETSAVGRAIAFLNLDIEFAIASREEMEKVERMSTTPNENVAKEVRDLWMSGKDATEEKLATWVAKHYEGVKLDEAPETVQREIHEHLKDLKARSKGEQKS